MTFKRNVILALSCLIMTGCSAVSLSNNLFSREPDMNTVTNSTTILRDLPAARVKPVVAVYDFTDQTGQNRPNDKLAEFSRAVTQGGASILSEALARAGSGNWFTVIERNGLEHLLRERQIIAATREQYGANPKLPPMLYAGVLLEGGIISYESNTLTGGAGAKWLGVGGASEYRQDIVTVYLRAVNVQNGEVLLSVNSAKTIYSTAITGGAYRFVALNRLLEIESGVTVNEPPQLAVRQAIEASVYSLIMEGALKGVWEFADANAGRLEEQRYLARVKKERVPDAEDVKPVEISQPVKTLVEESPEETVAVPALAPVLPSKNIEIPELAAEIHDSDKVEPAIVQVPEAQEPRQNIERKLKPLTERSDINKSRYDDMDAVSVPNSQMYCTQSGCYPVPVSQ